jgi:hypothetical protein
MTTPQFIKANVLRLGFFDGTAQYFHIKNIKIITDADLEIQRICAYRSTSTYPSQSPGKLRDILTDSKSNSFSHTNNAANEYLVVDFLKTYTIKQIVIENRTENQTVMDRIKNAQFRLYNEKNEIVYESNKITTGSAFYYINTNDKNVYSGQPAVITQVPDPTDKCNDPNLIKKDKPQLASICSCKKNADANVNALTTYNKDLEQYKIDMQYYNALEQDRKDHLNKTGDYKNWADKQTQLQNEIKYADCIDYATVSWNTWNQTCPTKFGNGWVNRGGDYENKTCSWPYENPICMRTLNQVTQDLNAAGYLDWIPPTFTATNPTFPSLGPVTCCSISFDNITSTSGNINVSDIKQTCTTEINSKIDNALKPLPTSPPTSKTTSNTTSNTPSNTTTTTSNTTSDTTSSSLLMIIGIIAGCVILAIIIVAAIIMSKKKRETSRV